MKKGKIANSDGRALTNETQMKQLQESDSYKHLGVI